ncbi:MAG: MerR family transcriptional regulator [Acidobacteriota bacterium]
MVTIKSLAEVSGLSRSALLYYDRLGLLKPTGRNRAGYRLYSNADIRRLQEVCMYRQMGISLKEIKRILDTPSDNVSTKILQRRLRSLNDEIDNLRRQQQTIIRLLDQKHFQRGASMLNKNRWVEIMQAAGLTEEDMRSWHKHFEKMEPEAHQEFLESLGIDPDEIDRIRRWSTVA